MKYSQIAQFSNATLGSKLHFCSNQAAHKLSIEPRPPNRRRRVTEAKEGLRPTSCTLPQDVDVFGRNNQIREGGCLRRVQHPAQEASRFWVVNHVRRGVWTTCPTPWRRRCRQNQASARSRRRVERTRPTFCAGGNQKGSQRPNLAKGGPKKSVQHLCYPPSLI